MNVCEFLVTSRTNYYKCNSFKQHKYIIIIKVRNLKWVLLQIPGESAFSSFYELSAFLSSTPHITLTFASVITSALPPILPFLSVMIPVLSLIILILHR